MLPRAPIVLGLTLLAAPRAASALDAGDWQVGLTANLAAGFDDGVHPGGGGRLDGRYGITDALSAWAAVGSLWWSTPRYTTRVTSASAGLTLAFDVLRTVPFVSLGVAAAEVDGTRLGGELNVGGEYLFDPKWSLALVGSVQLLPIRLGGSKPDGGAVALGLRLGRTF
jgi:hypothetical protein